MWLKALKGSLGCGGVVEEEALVLQGDQRERLPALLAARGVRKVTVGGQRLPSPPERARVRVPVPRVRQGCVTPDA